jgi:hypothetical protein
VVSAAERWDRVTGARGGVAVWRGSVNDVVQRWGRQRSAPRNRRWELLYAPGSADYFVVSIKAAEEIRPEAI